MGIIGWATIHWFELLQTLGIIAGFLFTAHTIRADSRGRKIQSLFALTSAHREIWSNIYEYPHLANVLRSKETSFTEDQELFVQFLILQLAASYRAQKLGMYMQENGLELDVRELFSLPIPRAVWEKAKVYQESDFVKFVESCLDVGKT